MRTAEEVKHWIAGAVDMAVLILEHRGAQDRDQNPGLRIYKRISTELLGITIWKYSEAHGHKYRDSPYWSLKASDHYQKGKNFKGLRHEHVFPQIELIKLLVSLTKPDHASVVELYEKYAMGVVVTEEEDHELSDNGRGKSTVPGGHSNPWLRYVIPNCPIKVVDSERIPAWHRSKLTEAGLLVSAPESSNRLRATSGAQKRHDGRNEAREARVNKAASIDATPLKASEGAALYAKQYPKLPEEGFVHLLTSDNPKRGKCRERFDYVEGMSVAETLRRTKVKRADLRWDIAHGHIEIVPTPIAT
jgi:hypothetical protein